MSERGSARRPADHAAGFFRDGGQGDAVGKPHQYLREWDGRSSGPRFGDGHEGQSGGGHHGDLCVHSRPDRGIGRDGAAIYRRRGPDHEPRLGDRAGSVDELGRGGGRGGVRAGIFGGDGEQSAGDPVPGGHLRGRPPEARDRRGGREFAGDGDAQGDDQLYAVGGGAPALWDQFGDHCWDREHGCERRRPQCAHERA